MIGCGFGDDWGCGLEYKWALSLMGVLAGLTTDPIAFRWWRKDYRTISFHFLPVVAPAYFYFEGDG